MSRRLTRLQQLLHIKKEATAEAYKALLRAKEEFQRSKARLDQLVGYREDYLQQLDVIGRQGVEVTKIRIRIDFIGQLDKAMTQLNQHLAQLATARRQAEQAFKQARLAEESVSKLMERVRAGEEVVLQRKEQKESDEYAQKQWYSKNNNLEELE